MLKNVFGIIYAGEQNLNLVELIAKRSVAALPVFGRYRVIDFVLSNMVNSGVRNIGVIAQRNYHSLMDHLGSGKEWNLSRRSDGLFILPPFDTPDNIGAYRGICDAVKGVMGYMRKATQQYVLLSGSYTMYNTTYNDMLDFHIKSGADVTCLYNVEQEHSDGIRFKETRMLLDETGRVRDIMFNSDSSSYPNIGMDIYLLKKDLLEYLVDDVTSRGKYNFVSDVLIANIERLKIFGYKHDGYVGRMHSIQSYYDLNIEMLDPQKQLEVFYKDNPIFTKIKDEVPAKYGTDANVKNSMIANGCIVEGTVENSVLFRGAYVGRNTTVKNSIVMQDTKIYHNCWIENAILDKQVSINSGKSMVGTSSYPIVIKKGAVV